MDDKHKTPEPPEYLEFSQILEENHNDMNVIPKDAPTTTADLICLECRAKVQGPIRFYQHIRDYCERFIERVDYVNQKDHFDREYRKLKDASLKDCYSRSIVKKKLVNDDDNVITCIGSSPLARYFEMDELKVWRKEQPPESTNAKRLILRSSIDREGENFVLYYDFTDVQIKLAEEKAEKERLAKEKAEKETNDDEGVDASSEDETDEEMPDKSGKEPYVDSEEESYFKYDDEAHRNRRRSPSDYKADDWPIPKFPPKKPDTEDTPVTSDDDTPDNSSDSDESEGVSGNEDGSHLNLDATDNHQAGNEDSAETDRSMAPIASSHEVEQPSEPPVYEHEVQSAHHASGQATSLYQNDVSGDVEGDGEKSSESASVQRKATSMKVVDEAAPEEQYHDAEGPSDRKMIPSKLKTSEKNSESVRDGTEKPDASDAKEKLYERVAFNSADGSYMKLRKFLLVLEIYKSHLTLVPKGETKEAAAASQHNLKKIYMEERFLRVEEDSPLLPFIMDENLIVRFEYLETEIFLCRIQLEDGKIHRLVFLSYLNLSSSGPLGTIENNATTSEIPADDRDLEEMEVDGDVAPATNDDDVVQNQVDVLPEEDTNQVELEEDEGVVDPIVSSIPQIDKTGSKYFEGLFAGYQGDDTKAETEEEIVEEWKEINVAIVVMPNKERNLFARSRIDVIKNVDELKTRVPNGCSEAERANRKGSFSCKIEFPGIPSKKCAPKDPEKQNQEFYAVQAVYEPKRNMQKCTVLYEGWRELRSIPIQNIFEDSPLILNVSRTRSAFLNMISETENIKKIEKITRPYRYLKITENRGGLFWLAEDMSYFHSRVQDSHRLGPVIYVILHTHTKYQPSPFSFTPINVISVDIYKRLVSEKANEPFSPSAHTSVKRQKIQGNCTNASGCLCNSRFEELYQDQAELVRIQPNGLLDLDSFSPDRNCLMVECSEVCECETKCPRRRMQNGSMKHSIVYFRDSTKGYSLRSGASFEAGEYLGEFTGEIRNFDPNLTANQLQFKVMDSNLAISYENIGNQFRFLNRSSNPNVILVETYSRRFESDPLLPRVGVYASKDISFGEEMTMPE